MEGEAKVKKVCVTGGSGFIGSWLVMRLLQSGYSVSTTVRPDPDNKKDYSFLRNLEGASDRLQIHSADLDDPDSFIPAFQGCFGVFHVAAPLGFGHKQDEQTAINNSINGALGVLKACLNSKTVKKVVYTSSATAVQCNGSGATLMDETFWSDVDYIKNNVPFGRSYLLSKTLTEKAVLEFSQQHGLEVVSVIPTLLAGPFICPNLPVSVRTALALVLGNEEEYRFHSSLNVVHVDDVVRAHIFLLEHPTANGRFICSSNSISLRELAQLLSAKYPEFQLPSPESLKDDVKGGSSVSSKKLLDSGFQYKYGIDEIFDDAIQCCKEKGFL